MDVSSEHNDNLEAQSDFGEKRTYYVLILTLTTMFVEIIAGTIYGSMALLADGWHMGTHAAAFCITLIAYRYAKKNRNTGKFVFGTGKVGVLGGYTSAIALGMVALLMFIESAHRLFNPQMIQFNEAIIVAIVGLVVNLASVYLLGGHHHSHEHHHHDHNLKAAYMHVLADVLTSVLAIVALIFAKVYGWNWLDAIMGMIGAIVITKWTLNLLKETSPILLDENRASKYREAITKELAPFATVMDIHLWNVSEYNYSAAIRLKSTSKMTINEFRNKLSKFKKIQFLTIEVC